MLFKVYVYTDDKKKEDSGKKCTTMGIVDGVRNLILY